MGRSQDEVGAVTGTPDKPLDHRVRRCILRCLREHGPLTAVEIATELGRESNEVIYHLRVLTEHGLVEEDETKAEITYEARIAEKAKVIELLISTRAEDEAQP
jgi:predicted ArsR family transcriptional regulator